MKGKRQSTSSIREEMEDDDNLSSLSDTSSEADTEESESENNERTTVEGDTPRDKTHRGGRRKGQSYRSSYDTDTLKAAYNAVVEDGMPVYAASKKFSVPQSTLRDRVLGRISADVTTSGPPTIFTAEEEAGIASYVRLFSDIGHPLSRNKVRQVAGELAAQLQRRGFTDGKVLSLRWYYKLIDRFPDMQSQKFANSKLQEIGYGYYKKLTEVFEECSLEGAPKRIFTLDEICVQTEASSLTMICRNVSGEHGDVSMVCNDNTKISVLGCFSANGKKVPPCFVFANNGDSPSRKTISKIQHGAIVKYTSTGESTPKILKEYFELHFSHFVKIGPKAKKHLVFYDSDTLSIPMDLWFWAERNNVVFFPLPLHKVPRKEYSVLRSTVCLKGVREMYEMEQKLFEDKNPGIQFSSSDACKILSRLYNGLTGPHLEQAFTSAGIYPLPDRNPGILRFEKIIEDMKHETKLKRKRSKKNVTPVPEVSPPKRGRKVKSKPKRVKSKQMALKKATKMTETIRHPVPVDWTGIIAQDENMKKISVRSLSNEGDGQEFDTEHTENVEYSHSSHKVDSFENGMTLELDNEGVQIDGDQETYYVYIQGAECISENADADTENVPVLVAEEVIIMNTDEV